MDKQKILEKIDTDFVIQLLEEYGSTYKKTNTDIRFIPICHGGDKHTLIYYDDTKMFNCVTCCGFMDIFALVQKILGCNFKESLSFLSQRLGLQREREGFVRKQDKQLQKLLDRLDVNSLHSQFRESLPVKDLSYYYYFDENTFYKSWIDEGISIDTMRKFRIRWDERHGYVIIPCRNVEGQIIGVRKRRTIDNWAMEEFGKYGFVQKYSMIYKDKDKKPIILLDYSFATGASLYGAYENLKKIQTLHRCVLLEGEKSVLKAISMYGEYPCACTYGCNVSVEQIRLLQELNVHNVVLAYDCDKSEEHLQNQKNKIERYGISCDYIYTDREKYLDAKDAPIDKGKDVWETLYRKRIKNG